MVSLSSLETAVGCAPETENANVPSLVSTSTGSEPVQSSGNARLKGAALFSEAALTVAHQRGLDLRHSIAPCRPGSSPWAIEDLQDVGAVREDVAVRVGGIETRGGGRAGKHIGRRARQLGQLLDRDREARRLSSTGTSCCSDAGSERKRRRRILTCRRVATAATLSADTRRRSCPAPQRSAAQLDHVCSGVTASAPLHTQSVLISPPTDETHGPNGRGHSRHTCPVSFGQVS